MSEPRLIIVTGVPRSGSPVVAACLEACGCWPAGGAHTAQTQIYERMVKPVLRGLGIDLNGPHIGGDPERMRTIAAKIGGAWRRDTFEILSRNGYSWTAPWLYHGPDACLAWPIWQAAFPDAQWVIVRRSDAEIAAACQKTGYMSRFADPAEFGPWMAAHKKMFADLAAAGALVHEIWPSGLFRGEVTPITQLVGALGIAYDPDAVTALLRPLWWKRGLFDTPDLNMKGEDRGATCDGR